MNKRELSAYIKDYIYHYMLGYGLKRQGKLYDNITKFITEITAETNDYDYIRFCFELSKEILESDFVSTKLSSLIIFQRQAYIFVIIRDKLKTSMELWTKEQNKKNETSIIDDKYNILLTDMLDKNKRVDISRFI